MKPFKKIKSTAVSIETENVDTDQIIPARFLKTIKRSGLGKFLFYNWRRDEQGKLKKSIFNNKETFKKKILITENNFGSGSSREHAVWALMDYGFKAIISSGFGDIFYSNAFKNGLLCVVLKNKEIEKIIKIIKNNPDVEISVNLEKQYIEIPDNNLIFKFEIDRFRKTCMLLGVDEMGYIFSHEDKIKEFEMKISKFK